MQEVPERIRRHSFDFHYRKRRSSPAPGKGEDSRMRHTEPASKTRWTGSPGERRREAIRAIEGRCPTHRTRSCSLLSPMNARNISAVASGDRASVSRMRSRGYPAAAARISAVWRARRLPLDATRSRRSTMSAMEEATTETALTPSALKGREGSRLAETASPCRTSQRSISPGDVPPPVPSLWQGRCGASGIP